MVNPSWTPAYEAMKLFDISRMRKRDAVMGTSALTMLANQYFADSICTRRRTVRTRRCARLATPRELGAGTSVATLEHPAIGIRK